MCGIAGYIGKSSISEDVIKNTLDLMRNRGPDHQNSFSTSFQDTNIYLLHSRLSIIDLDSRSNQPFVFQGNVLVFNGEIYNYIELRKRLQLAGHSFVTNSDTEVVIKAYAEYGEDCVNEFNGMWSFAIWDGEKRKLFLSRDRFAEKPLFYLKEENGLFFGSEIKAIQSLRQRKLKVNLNHVKRYLVYGYKFLNQVPDEYFHEIRQIDVGANATVDSIGRFTQSKYWQPIPTIKNITLEESIEEARYHLLESVRLRLRADVPLAFCLSGGIDSASLASIAKKKFDYKVSAFSIFDPDPRSNELENIQATVNDLGCESTLVELNYRGMLERLHDLVDYHDSPVATISYLIHSMLSEKINENGYKVAVSGTAADELFTGYYDHFNLHLYEMREHPDYETFLSDWQIHTGKYIRNPYLKDPELYFEDQSVRNHNHLNSEIFSSFLMDGLSVEYNEVKFTDSLLRNRMLNELFHESTRVILHEDDLNSMQYSIENRSPFLDVNLFNAANSIPNENLIRDGYGKYVLRQAVAGILNDKVRLDRQKKGFNASISSILDLKDPLMKDYLMTNSPVFDIVRKEKIEQLLKRDYFENSFQKFLFNFLNVKIFLEKFA